MINKIKILFLFILLSTFIFAQQQDDSRKVNQEPGTPLSMEDEIKKLKNGVLLVRLQTKEKSITALKKEGQNELAHKIDSIQSKYNKDIVSAFRKSFSFCPVYFFLSNNSENVLSKKINEIVFVNDSLETDSTIHLKNSAILTAEFGSIEQDTTQYLNGSLHGEKSYQGGPDMKFDALKIMSDRFIQLKSPFPYYIRTWAGTPFERPLSKVISKMNDQLSNFYEKVTSP